MQSVKVPFGGVSSHSSAVKLTQCCGGAQDNHYAGQAGALPQVALKK